MNDHARDEPRRRVIPAKATCVIPAKAGIQMRAAITAIIACVAAAPSNAQWLELSARPDPPALSDDTYAAALAAQLEAEINQHAADETTARAALNIRRLARSLLLSQSNDPAEASVLILRGMKLHDQRSAIDAALDRIRRDESRGSSDVAAKAISLLRDFNDLTARRLARDQPLAVNESAALLAPLEDAINLHRKSPSKRPQFSVLPDRAAAEDAMRELVAEIADFFERGWTFADLRPRIAKWHALIEESLGFIAAVTDATWLSETQRAESFDRLRHALHIFRDPQRRSEGERLLQALIAEAEFLRTITILAQNRTHRFDLDSIRAALNRAHQAWGVGASPPDPDRLIERLQWLTVIAERMNRFRALDRDDTPFDLRRIRVQVVEAYLGSEKSLLKHLESLAAQRRSAVADPALAALLAEHRRLLDDLARLQGMSRWADAITLIRPGSAAKFDDQLRRLANQLGDPVRRVDAAAAMDRIESEVSRFWPMPFEHELRLRSRVAEAATGNRYRELLDALDARREQWARELGDDGPALTRPHAQRLEALHQLMSAMADVGELLREEHAASRLNLEDDWWLPPDVPRIAMERLLPMLHRACAAAVEDDEQRLVRELRLIGREGALARLIGRLLANGGGGSNDRGDLALICRYAAEAAHVHSKDRPNEAREFWRYANRMAAIVLNRI